MGIKTEIGWCDSTVNEIVGCDGCELHRAGEPNHCYAAGLVGRYAGLPGWGPSFDHPTVIPGRLAKAIQWPDLTGKPRAEKPWLNGYPRLIFTCDLSDPFTKSIDPETWLTPLLPRMADSPHIYILLTKRGRRMLAYWQHHEIPRNVWQGVTVTGPQTANRIDSLMQVPGASVRFVSMEPLLGHPIRTGIGNIDWVIVGGESGPCARPMHPEWVRSIRDLCHRNNRAFFFKQWGEWAPKQRFQAFAEWDAAAAHALIMADGSYTAVKGRDDPDPEMGLTCADLDGNDGAAAMARIGVKPAGRMIDGALWTEMPQWRT